MTAGRTGWYSAASGIYIPPAEMKSTFSSKGEAHSVPVTFDMQAV
jgi:hypothetical protein